MGNGEAKSLYAEAYGHELRGGGTGCWRVGRWKAGGDKWEKKKGQL